jgi:hypothetical protein
MCSKKFIPKEISRKPPLGKRSAENRSLPTHLVYELSCTDLQVTRGSSRGQGDFRLLGYAGHLLTPAPKHPRTTGALEPVL